MKRLLIWLIAAIIMQAPPAYARDVAAVDSLANIENEIKNQCLKLIGQADSLTVIAIDPWSVSDEDRMEGYGEILYTVDLNDKEILTQWYEILSDPDNFEYSDVVKNCTFMPDYALAFHSAAGDTTVAYSFYCDTLRFADEDEYVDNDGEIIRLQFLELLNKTLPKDRYLRSLIQKTKSNF